MVIKFRLISKEVKGFQRDIEILSDQSFYKLHHVLSQDFHYDNSQLASFFTTDQKGNRIQEIALFDISEGQSKNIKLMDKCLLRDYISTKGDRLIYVFDSFNERKMSLEILDIFSEKKGTDYPQITESKKSPPPQVLILDNNFDDLEFDE